MIYTKMTISAMKTAYNAHLGQLDYNDVPYIFHPYHLAEQMDDEISCTVALLHDVVEDTSLTFADLEQIFPKQVVEIVMLLTHDEKVDYFDYIQKIKTNAIAVKVKLADLEHNSNEDRSIGSNLTQEQLLYWKEKYAKAKEMLLL
ncbi:MAG: bifunctional (p)ppGpp synthetase/guanosine-3',5'-bis(diphosphate) 3'-pyrophosphohydrolase [Clostridia bacterium]|nr:bifunctional (p)ppGpp synthetase/guanosine-3',5'-bis(diphosphate) 3'-pyrophosphohydrolase [Clostridia bacterium]